jgi:Ca2+/Na+ antiporter
MISKFIFVAFICVMLGLGTFFVVYGIKGGLIEKKILANAWRHEYETGKKATKRGWFYIIIGVIFLIVLASVILDSFTG